MKRVWIAFGVAAIGWAAPANAAPAYTTFSYATATRARETSIELVLPTAGNPMACSVAGTFRLQSTASNYQTIVAAILSAVARGKQVSVYSHACDSDGISLFIAVQNLE